MTAGIKREEAINIFTHLAGAVASPFVALILILLSGRSGKEIFALTVYGLCMTMLFSASALYHYKKKGENEKSIWRTLDHISIFFMIAGTYTPFCLLVLQGTWAIVILSIQWGLVALGLILKLSWLRSPRWFTTGVYLAMGWVAVFAMKPLYDNGSAGLVAAMIVGGAIYSLGAAIYAFKKPNPVPGFFGFHEIFHFLILAASAVFTYGVYMAVSL